jgi:hypothetical protein
MQKLDFSKYANVKKQKPPPHPLSACSELIREAGIYKNEDKKYGRTYWLGVLSRHCKKKNKAPESMYTELLGLLKEASGMDGKYSKGGWLTNKLR